MRRTTKIGLWLFVPSGIWMLALLSGAVKFTDENVVLIGVGLFSMVAIPYGLIFLLISGLEELYKFTLFQIFFDRTRDFIGGLFSMSIALVLIVLALYLVYLFVSWAGLIGTLLFIIAVFLFVLVLLALGF